MIDFDNSFFFDKNCLNFKNNSKFNNNFEKTKKIAENLKKELEKGENEILSSFTSKYQENIRKIQKEIDTNSKKKVIVGFGGSSSGAKALSFFIKDELVFLDNLDYAYLKDFFIKKKIEEHFFFVVSKSGETFETLAILNLLIDESKNIKDFNLFQSMIIITDNNDSTLYNFAIKNKIKVVEHNSNIGGRFSVLSETGILPFIDHKLKVENASEKYINFLISDFNNNLNPVLNVALLATIIQEMHIKIYCNLLYNYRLKHFSYWFHQLHAESLGKNKQGLTPTTSVCPKDHHSMMQLYLDGPKDKFFNIFSPPDKKFFEKFRNENFYSIENYDPNSLLNKQYNSVIEIFRSKKIPHRVINIKDCSDPMNLIELFSYFLLETILLGKVFDINPYDQPSVQLIKEKIFKN